MKKKQITKKLYFTSILVFLFIWYVMPANVFGWTDQAHMAMGLAAGFRCFQNCSAADISHTVATINGLTQSDSQAHFFNVPDDYELSVDDILSDKEEKYPVYAAIKLADEVSVGEELDFATEEELVEAIVALAKQTQILAKEMRDKQRLITREEAIRQISDAAALGKAIMSYCGK